MHRLYIYKYKYEIILVLMGEKKYYISFLYKIQAINLYKFSFYVFLKHFRKILFQNL